MRLAACFAFSLLPLVAQGIWETRAPYPVAATEVSGAEAGGKIYMMCGLLQAGDRLRVFSYDPLRDAWEDRAPLPIMSGADHCNVASAGGRIYLLGAIRIGSAFVDGTTYEYDPSLNRWQQVATMNVPRGASAVAAIGTKIYVAGGLAGNAVVRAFEVFDTVSRTWTRLTDMPTQRDHLTGAAVNGKFYAIGGRDGSIGANLAANEEYDPATNQWTRRANMPTPRGGLASGVINNRIIVFGGEGASGRPEQTFAENEEYNPVNDTWRPLAPMRTPRHGFYGIVANGVLHAPAGGPQIGGTFSNAHEVFFAPPPQSPRIDRSSNAAANIVEVGPGAAVSLYGEFLAPGDRSAASFPLPAEMLTVSARGGGRALPLLAVTPRQINLVLPFDVSPGDLAITVRHAGTESPASILRVVAASPPGLFALDGSGAGQGAILIAGTGLIARATRDAFSRAPRHGEVVEIYCSSLGEVNDPPAFGQPAPLDRLTPARETPGVWIGGVEAEVLFAGLTPGLAGVYQINARIAAGTPVGIAVPVVARRGGRESNTVTMAVVD